MCPVPAGGASGDWVAGRHTNAAKRCRYRCGYNQAANPNRALLRGVHQIRNEKNTHLAPQQVEKNRNPLSIVHAFVKAEAIAECAGDNTHRVARTESCSPLETDQPALVLSPHQSLNDPLRNSGRVVPAAHEPRNANR